MENVCHKYMLQIQKVRETIDYLENELDRIRKKLKDSPNHSDSLRELKQRTLDMTITLNELEHCQSMLEDCEATYAKVEVKYKN